MDPVIYNFVEDFLNRHFLGWKKKHNYNREHNTLNI